MSRPRLLDLFSGAGGAAVGYHRAGFGVVGVDHAPQKNYPFEFHQADALEFLSVHGHEFDAIHASPPCQGYSDLKTAWNAKRHPKVIEDVRAALQEAGLPYVIENVEGAPLHDPIVLCGSMFGLRAAGCDLRRHRLFETWPPLPVLCRPCIHGHPVIGIYGDHVRNRGHYRHGSEFPGQDKKALAREALGIDWMEWRELTQAIPPAYTEFLGAQLLRALDYAEDATA